MVAPLISFVAPLFVPGSRSDRFHKAEASGADAIILDLEDAVAEDGKDAARDAVLAFLPKATCPVIVRVNGQGTPWHEADVEALARCRPTALMLPKAESAASVMAVCKRLGAPVPIIALIETAKGLAHISEIAGAPNVAILAFGSVDFSLDIGCSHEQLPLLSARSEIVWRSRAAGLAAPLDGVTVNLDDANMLDADATHAAALGFGGKLAIHPKQIAPIRNAFLPSEQTIEWAREVLAAASSGNAVRVHGEMVDRPVVERARRILSFAEG